MSINSLLIVYKPPRSFSRFALQCTISCGWLATVSVDFSFVFMLQCHKEEHENVKLFFFIFKQFGYFGVLAQCP